MIDVGILNNNRVNFKLCMRSHDTITLHISHLGVLKAEHMLLSLEDQEFIGQAKGPLFY